MLFDWLLRRRRDRRIALVDKPGCRRRSTDASDAAKELDARQHEVARRLHVLEYETSEAVQDMRRRKQESQGRGSS